MQFLQLWHSAAVSENQIITLMVTPMPPPTRHRNIVVMQRLYQSLIVDELASIDALQSQQQSSSSTVSRCCVCDQSPVEEQPADGPIHCALCSPRSHRPTINEMAQLNKLLKQCPNIISVYGIALQALSKRTVTWLVG